MLGRVAATRHQFGKLLSGRTLHNYTYRADILSTAEV